MIGAKFEACVESLSEACEAAAWGADRLELCAELVHDGCTPALALASDCSAAVEIPVIAMVRSRRGAFVYSGSEIDAMCRAMGELRSCGVAGFATGALLRNDGIDLAATARLVAAAKDLPVTFHRAFDHVPDAGGALEALIGLGVRRVLTAGGAGSAIAGTEALRRLVDRAAGRIEVIAAGTIRPFNVQHIVAATGVPVVHARWSAWRQAPGGRGRGTEEQPSIA